MNAELYYERETLFQNVVLDLAWLIHSQIDIDPEIVSWEAQEEAIEYVKKEGVEAGQDILVRGGFAA